MPKSRGRGPAPGPESSCVEAPVCVRDAQAGRPVLVVAGAALRARFEMLKDRRPVSSGAHVPMQSSGDPAMTSTTRDTRARSRSAWYSAAFLAILSGAVLYLAIAGPRGV